MNPNPEPGENQSPILINLWIPPLTHFLLTSSLPLRLSSLHLNPFTGPQNLTLEIKTATFLWIVEVEQFLESFHDLFDIGFAALRWFDVEDATGFVESQTAGCEGVGGSSVAFGCFGGVFGRGGGLSVGFGEGAAEDAGAGEDDLGDYSVGLDWLIL